MPRTAAPSSIDPAAVRGTLEEHRRLHAAIETLEEALTTPPPTGDDRWRAALVERLDALHAALALHFAEEERRHLFEIIQETNPSAASACRRLRCEHRRLLNELGRLRAEVERTGASRAS